MRKSKRKFKPTEKEKAIVREIYEYIKTSEGEKLGEEIRRLLERWRKQEKSQLTKLTEQEEKAFKFIKEELLLKRQPTVRDVARHLGLKSSRWGARIINRLIVKGILTRRING